MAEYINRNDSLNQGREKLNKGIEASNRAEQKSDQAVNTSNEANETSQTAEQKADNVQDQFNNVVIEGDSSVEAAQARVKEDGTSFDTLRDRLNSSDSQLAETSHMTGSNDFNFWKAPQIPSARTDHSEYFIDAFKAGSDYYLDELFEPLRNGHPNYISRFNLGKDQSGEFDVWRYDFTPRFYEKTIIITAGVHGSEIQGTLSFYLFMKEVAENWRNDPRLNYIRNKVRIISIPIVNAWGVSQSPRRYGNSNSVNIVRNFDYKWGQYSGGGHGDDNKGSAPWSEIETVYIRDLILNNPDAVAYSDFHALSGGSGFNAVAYMPRTHSEERDLYQFFEHFAGNKEYSIRMNNHPTGFNWAAELGMQSSCPEWPSEEYGTRFGSEEMTKSTEYFGNIILIMAQSKQTYAERFPFDPVTHHFNYEGVNPNALTIESGSSYIDLPELTGAFDAPMKGIVIVNGGITLRGDDDSARHDVIPWIGQTGGFIEPNVLEGQKHGYFFGGTERENVPISLSLPVLPTTPSAPSNVGSVKLGLRLRTNAGNLTVYRYHAMATFIPTARGDSLKTYFATGNEGQGEDAMQLSGNGWFDK